MTSAQDARWFEDWVVGETVEVEETYSVDEASIIEFASEYDPQPFHTDPVAAQDTVFGGLVASGWHSGSIMMRLLSSLLGESSLGSPGCDELRWSAPVRPGDTLSLRVTPTELVPSRSKPDRGVLYLCQELLNQDGTVVMTLASRVMLKRRGPHGSP